MQPVTAPGFVLPFALEWQLRSEFAAQALAREAAIRKSFEERGSRLNTRAEQLGRPRQEEEMHRPHLFAQQEAPSAGPKKAEQRLSTTACRTLFTGDAEGQEEESEDSEKVRKTAALVKTRVAQLIPESPEDEDRLAPRDGESAGSSRLAARSQAEGGPPSDARHQEIEDLVFPSRKLR